MEQVALAQDTYTLLYSGNAACVDNLCCRHVALCLLGEQARRNSVCVSRLAQECGSQRFHIVYSAARALHRGSNGPDVVVAMAPYAMQAASLVGLG